MLLAGERRIRGVMLDSYGASRSCQVVSIEQQGAQKMLDWKHGAVLSQLAPVMPMQQLVHSRKRHLTPQFGFELRLNGGYFSSQLKFYWILPIKQPVK
jgi:hypothetical protein